MGEFTLLCVNSGVRFRNENSGLAEVMKVQISDIAAPRGVWFQKNRKVPDKNMDGYRTLKMKFI